MVEGIDYYVTLHPLPGGIRGFVTKREDIPIIVINDNLSHEEKVKAFVHEITHIERGDLDSSDSVAVIEGRM
jgi:Zn-dependent peptidase ImmA (M78 family)